MRNDSKHGNPDKSQTSHREKRRAQTSGAWRIGPLLLLAWFYSIAIATAAAVHVPYFTDFEGVIGSEWSSASADSSATPAFTRFSGRFGNETQTLALSDLTAGSSYTVVFDLYILDSWDGNGGAGPDYFNVSVDGAQLLRHTFSNYNGTPPSQPQSFPEEPESGRISLGFNSSYVDAIYRSIEVTFTASGPTAQISFRGEGLQELNDESWGVDNVSVRLASDAPASAILVISLPEANSTSSAVIDSFLLSASRALDASSAGASQSYALREAGPDGLIGNGDDSIYALTPSYNGSKTVTLTFLNSPLQPGRYRFETNAGLKDIGGNSVANIVRDFTIANPVGGQIENTNNQTRLDGTPLPLSETPAGSAFYTALGVGKFSSNADVDYWSFNGEAGDKITLRLEASELNTYPQLELQNPGGVGVVAANGSYSGVAQIQSFILTGPGTYYVRVYNTQNPSLYKLRVDQSRGPQFELEGNDSQNSANFALAFSQTGQAVVAGTLPADDWSGDYYQLGSLNSGNGINATLVFPAGSSLNASRATISIEAQGNPVPLATSSTGTLNYITGNSAVYFLRIQGADGRDIRSQYILSIDLSDSVAPLIARVSLPEEGGSSTALFDRFSLSFSEDMVAGPVNNTGNFELRGAGKDGLFGTVDDLLYSLRSEGYSSGLSASYRIVNGPLQAGAVRFTASTALTDRAGNPLGAPFTRTFSIADVPGIILENRNNNTRANATSLSLTPGAVGDGGFIEGFSEGGSSQPRDIELGDFNKDGHLDLETGNVGNNTVGVRLGRGDATFQNPVDYSVGSGPLSVTAGDFNNDGKLDLVAGNFYAATVSVLLGNGDGTFQSARAFDAGSNPRVVVGDFNGDGKLDVASANEGSANVSVLVGNGDGTFQSAVNYAVGASPQSLAVADFNGDGKPDLVAANAGSA
ncbi:MAG: hypothetical protein JWL59_282, partial [Chthoniobacteraceae bacterium]|nr:hypothetical protein [Chthoniobacteraceae bacterium]